MKKLVFSGLVLFIGSAINFGYSQTNNDPVLLTVAGEKITKSEFLSVYKKNNVKGDAMDRKSLEEYLDLYINFKLKVKEAEELGLDTVATFKTELAGYRKQLAQPYMTDKQVDDKLLLEAYDRMQWDIRASHLLIKVDKNAPPEDTLTAYKKIMKLRDRIIKGEPFDKVARESSDDPSAKDREDGSTKSIIKGNGGDLGFFTALDMIYPFETAAYNTKVSEVSMPVRTDYGYHLIKVTDRKTAMGKVQVAHLFIQIPKDVDPKDSAQYKARIFEANDKIKNGGNYEELVTEYSDDKGSAAKGGVLPAFGVNRMVPEFIVAIAKLKNVGDISEPVRTAYGWHIIKLIDVKPIRSFDEEKALLKSRVLKDGRSSASKTAVLQRIRVDYGFKEFPETQRDFYSIVDTSVFEGKWEIQKAQGLGKTMFSILNTNYTQKDFAGFIASHQAKHTITAIPNYVTEKYNAFVEENLLQFEDSRLEDKYPEFKSLMKEYRDGILLFELTDQKVWSKAIQDTAGLKGFHEGAKNNYMWDERLDVSTYTCSNTTTCDLVRKEIKKLIKGKLTEKDLLAKINTDSIPVLQIQNKLYLHKESQAIDSLTWEKGYVSPNIAKDTMIVFMVVNRIVPPGPKSLKEAKGLVTADYQNHLEKDWIESLRKKYSWEINKPVFESLFQ